MLAYLSDLITASLTAYIVACVIGASSLFEPMRIKIMHLFPKLGIGTNKHPIECRLCLSFWTSCFSVLLFGLTWKMILPVYGLSYFITSQER